MGPRTSRPQGCGRIKRVNMAAGGRTDGFATSGVAIASFDLGKNDNRCRPVAMAKGPGLWSLAVGPPLRKARLFSRRRLPPHLPRLLPRHPRRPLLAPSRPPWLVVLRAIVVVTRRDHCPRASVPFIQDHAAAARRRQSAWRQEKGPMLGRDMVPRPKRVREISEWASASRGRRSGG